MWGAAEVSGHQGLPFRSAWQTLRGSTIYACGDLFDVVFQLRDWLLGSHVTPATSKRSLRRIASAIITQLEEDILKLTRGNIMPMFANSQLQVLF